MNQNGPKNRKIYKIQKMKKKENGQKIKWEAPLLGLNQILLRPARCFKKNEKEIGDMMRNMDMDMDMDMSIKTKE